MIFLSGSNRTSVAPLIVSVLLLVTHCYCHTFFDSPFSIHLISLQKQPGYQNEYMYLHKIYNSYAPVSPLTHNGDHIYSTWGQKDTRSQTSTAGDAGVLIPYI
jgi:hypothetical protein